MLLLGVTLLWCFAATAGRAATLRRLVAMFSADDESIPMTWQFAPIFVLHLLRAAWSLIAFSVAIACLIIGSVMADERPRQDWRRSSWCSESVCHAGLGRLLNWFLGMAPLFLHS